MSGGGSFILEGDHDVSTISIRRDNWDKSTYKIIDQLPASEASNPVPIPPEITIKNADPMSANNDMQDDQENGKNEVNNKSNMPLTGNPSPENT